MCQVIDMTVIANQFLAPLSRQEPPLAGGKPGPSSQKALRRVMRERRAVPGRERGDAAVTAAAAGGRLG